MVFQVVFAGVLSAIGALVGAPIALNAVGFTPAGVAVGSVAAALQAPATAAGGLFSACQSAGVLGLATITKVAISTVVGAVGTFVAALWP